MSAFPDISGFISPGNVPPVKSKVLAQLLPAIEAAFQAGHTHSQILAWLADNGLQIDAGYYHDALYRLRKKRHPVARLKSVVDFGEASSKTFLVSGNSNVKPVKTYFPVEMVSDTPRSPESTFSITDDKLLF